LIVSRASVYAFLFRLADPSRRGDAPACLWRRAGKIRFKEGVVEGIENMPEAFLRLLDGRNFAKPLVRVD
jgi:NADPH-dependent curcumin reductase CurA